MSKLTKIHIDYSKLREARERRGLMQAWVAEQIGVSKQSLSAYENNVSSPPSDVLARLCKLYDSDISDFTIEEQAA